MNSTRAATVSSEQEELILVDDNDVEIGSQSKARCHDGDGILHRAFSVFLFNAEGELLLQQRADEKRLWPRYWSNSCCSHPRRGEDVAEAAFRRLDDELNVKATLEFVYKFQYQANYQDLGAEHELCHVFLGRLLNDAAANPTEISALRFVNAADLDQEFIEQPERFTPWMKLEWQRLNSDHRKILDGYI